MIQERGSQGSSLLPADPDDSLTVLKNKKEGYGTVAGQVQCCGSRPAWIRIDLVGRLGPDPGGQKLLRKIEKNEEISCFKILDVSLLSVVEGRLSWRPN